jgi:hypothetical protein
MPAAACLLIAALLLTCAWKGKRPASMISARGFTVFFVRGVAVSVGILLGLVGLILLGTFLDEFSYFINK